MDRNFRDYDFVEQKAFTSFYDVNNMKRKDFVNPQIPRNEVESFFVEANANPVNVVKPLDFKQE